MTSEWQNVTMALDDVYHCPKR